MQDTREGKLLIYEGFLTTLVTRQLNLSVPYYTSVTNVLKRMGCVRQLRRGGGSAPSQWLLIKEPQEKDFLATLPKKLGRPHKTEPTSPVGDQRIADLTRRLNYLYSALGIPEPR